MEGARFSSERKALMEKQTSEFLVTLKIDKMERTLLVTPNIVVVNLFTDYWTEDHISES